MLGRFDSRHAGRSLCLLLIRAGSEFTWPKFYNRGLHTQHRSIVAGSRHFRRAVAEQLKTGPEFV